MAEFKAIETQDELDKIIQDRLTRQKEKYSDYDQLKSKIEELETENSALKTAAEETKKTLENNDHTVSDLNEKISGYETANLKTKIALQNGIPFDLADRLTGNDEETIKADAERLAGYMKPSTPPPLKSTEMHSISGKDNAYKNLIENMNLEGE